ncbi:17417_t:CDS:1, partial [Gigaspora rosea]
EITEEKYRKAQRTPKEKIKLIESKQYERHQERIEIAEKSTGNNVSPSPHRRFVARRKI